MAISEKDYMTKKTEIETKIAEIDEKIGIVNKNSVDNSITDEEFVDKASTFIITQKLTNRNYISYKRLATSVDPKILYMFTHDVIDYIDIYNGKVQRIVFRNGAPEILNWCFYFVLVWSSGLSADIIWIFYGHSIDFIRTVHANYILFFRSIAICTA